MYSVTHKPNHRPHHPHHYHSQHLLLSNGCHNPHHPLVFHYESHMRSQCDQCCWRLLKLVSVYLKV